ncbi:MAG: alpha/beta hydrolase [Henriciella sp.]|nr:alpha/beta hydrolase [Henriciella sp.]
MRHLVCGLSIAFLVAACTSVSAHTEPNVVEGQEVLQSSPAHEVLLKTTSNPRIGQGYIDGAEGQIHFWDAGQGAPVLLIHQASSSSEEFAGMVNALADEYRLVSFDWPGHGMSDDPLRELGVDDFTDAALAVLDHLSIETAHVLGNHGGALVAMNMAWKHPDRVERLVLSGTSGVKDMEAVQDFSDDLGLDEMNRIDRAGQSLSDAWDRYTRYMPQSVPGDILIPYMNNIMVRLRPYDAHYEVLRFDRRPALDAIKDKRILLMQAENDPFVTDQEMLLDILPNAERVVLEDVGLFNFYEAPQNAAEAMAEFLSKP